MQPGIQRLWKRWAVPYQEPAVLDETIFLPNNMVMRLRCLIVIVFSWEHGPMYKCSLYATVVHVHEGFLRLLTGRSSHCCLGGSSYWGGIFWCISTSLLFVVGQPVLVECFGFSSLKMWVLGGAVGQYCCVLAHRASSWLHCMTSASAAQGVLPSLLGESVPVETVICKSLGSDESQIMFLKNLRLFSPRYSSMQYVYYPPSLSLTAFFFFSFFCFGWANVREHWSELNGFEEV